MNAGVFEANKGTDGEADVVALRDFEAKLSAFDAGELLRLRW